MTLLATEYVKSYVMLKSQMKGDSSKKKGKLNSQHHYPHKNKINKFRNKFRSIELHRKRKRNVEINK